MAHERLQKVMAHAGIASRRAAERLIVEGRVRINGATTATLGCRVDPRADKIEVDGRVIPPRQPYVYIALHKPEGVVSTVTDPQGRPTVLDVVEASWGSGSSGSSRSSGHMPRFYPIGRLDVGAQGLLLLTNDGALTHTLLHPAHHVPKTYKVRVRSCPSEAALHQLRQGLSWRQEDGSWTRPTAPSAVQLLNVGRSNSWLEITIFEGRHHQVKNMFETIGHRVNRLIRVEFGGIYLDKLPMGAWRFLTHAETKKLKMW